MVVYNLTEQVLSYRGRDLPPNGGSGEYPELDVFIPNRDKELSAQKIIALGRLPTWWQDQQRLKSEAPPPPKTAEKVAIVLEDKVPEPEYQVVVEEKVEKRRKG